MECLLTSMGAAIRHVTQLTLNVDCMSSISASISPIIPPLDHSSITSFSLSDFPAVIHRMCEKLAAALPHLQRLQLAGICKDVGLGDFGFHCPKLTHLSIEACTVPVEALQGVEFELPSLTQFTLSRPPAGTQQQDIQQYVDTLLPLLSTCNKLKILEVQLEPETWATPTAASSDIIVKCCTEVWDLLPESLVELRCDVELCSLLGATSFISRVVVLTLKEFPAMSLVQLLDYAPLLKQITVTSPTAREVDLLPCVDELFTEDLDELKARMLGGFQLSCPSVYICESSETIQNLLSWLPPMADTNACTVQFDHDPGLGNCLDNLAKVLPYLTRLALRGEIGEPDYVITAQDPILASLASCGHLESLGLCMRMEFQHAELMKLVVSLPSLKGLAMHPSILKVSISASVMEELSAKGRDVKITEISEEGFFN